jgi:hypothetical protein
MRAEDRGRDEYVDTCRGVACVLLVAYHAIGAVSRERADCTLLAIHFGVILQTV